MHRLSLKDGIKVTPIVPVRMYMVYLLQQFLLASLNIPIHRVDQTFVWSSLCFSLLLLGKRKLKA